MTPHEKIAAVYAKLHENRYAHVEIARRERELLSQVAYKDRQLDHIIWREQCLRDDVTRLLKEIDELKRSKGLVEDYVEWAIENEKR